MKKVILKISVIAAAFFGLTGCLSEYDPETSSVTAAQVGASASALKSMVASIPAAMYDGWGLWGTGSSRQDYDFGYPGICIMKDSSIDDLVVLGDSGYDWFSTFAGCDYRGYQYLTTSYPWSVFYPFIKSVNDIINSCKESCGGDYSQLSAEAKVYAGIAFTYRALYYLELNDIYTYVENKYVTPEDPSVVGLSTVIVDENTTESAAKYNPRATSEKVFELINSDLEKAREFLKDYTSANITEPNYAVACGLSARAYLDQSNWTEALKWAQEALDKAGKTPLSEEEWTNPQTGFNSSASNNSWMWAIQLTSDNATNLTNFISHMSNEEEWTSYGRAVMRGINKYIYDKIPDADWRKQSWLDPDRTKFNYQTCLDASASKHPKGLGSIADYANIKFRPAQGSYGNYKEGCAHDFCMMRIEEMYFIKAEAQAHTSLSDAVATLNSFMNDYRYSDKSYDCSMAGSTIETLTAEIFQQKRVEFWGEGLMFADSKRLKTGFKKGYTGTNVTGDEYLLNADEIAPWWAFPITRSELLVNTAIPTSLNNPDPTGSIKPWKE